MKKKFIKLFTVVICLAFATSLFVGGCFPIIKDLEIKEAGYFQYVIVGSKDPFIAIVGLTKSGLEQEVLEIPREIDGKTVRHIGHRDDVRHNCYYVYSENLKKIYIHDNISYIFYFEKGHKGYFENGKKVEINEIGNENQVRVMICSMHDNFGGYCCALIKKLYYYKEIVDEKISNSNYASANIVFMNNYSNEVNGGYYRLDYIETDETIATPPAPKREGYVFTGWYTEAECVNVWDFNVSPALEDGEEFRLYAGWHIK